MVNKHDISRDAYMLDGCLASNGYDWWWHSFTGIDTKTGEEKPFFIEFFVINPKKGKKDPVFGQTKENIEKGIKPSYVMIKAGCWGEDHAQLHRFFGVKKVIISRKVPFMIKAGNCFLSEEETRGKVSVSKTENDRHPEWMSDAGEMVWNLKIDKKIAYNVGYGAGKLCRDLKAFEMYWHAEGMKTEYSGTVTFNGRTYDVVPEKSYGYADKNWGKNFTSPWVWLSSNNLYSRAKGRDLQNSVFDIGGGKPKVYFVPLDRKLLGAFVYEGKENEYNFSKFWSHTRTKFKSYETNDEVRWKVWQENRTTLMKTEVVCKKKDMILVNYEAPDGTKKHKRLWNGGNGKGLIRFYAKHSYGLELIDEIEVRNIGCEFGEWEN